MRRRLVSRTAYSIHLSAGFALVFLLLVLLYALIFQSTWSSAIGRELSFQGVRTEARINTVTPIGDERVHLAFSWALTNGQRKTGNTTVASRAPQNLRPGQPLPLVYLPRDPNLYALISQRPIPASFLLPCVGICTAAIAWLAWRLPRFKVQRARRAASLDFSPED